MLVLLVNASKILAVKPGTPVHQAACHVSMHALFLPAYSALVLLKWIIQTNMP
jgi:hypothetical protein